VLRTNHPQKPLNYAGITPVLAVDLLDHARTAAAALGVKTAPRFEDALASSDVDAPSLSAHHKSAALAKSPYPVTLGEMLANVRGFEAIQRSVKSGAIEIF
jgi:hypothetical protein